MSIVILEEAIHLIGQSRLSDMTIRQIRMMIMLKDYPDGLRTRLIAERMDVAKPIVSRATNTLEKEGMVQRIRGDYDRREIFVVLTKFGRDALLEASVMTAPLSALAEIAGKLTEARDVIAEALYDLRPGAGFRTIGNKVVSYAIPWADAHDCHRADAREEADVVLSALRAHLQGRTGGER